LSDATAENKSLMANNKELKLEVEKLRKQQQAAKLLEKQNGELITQVE